MIKQINTEDKNYLENIKADDIITYIPLNDFHIYDI